MELAAIQEAIKASQAATEPPIVPPTIEPIVTEPIAPPTEPTPPQPTERVIGGVSETAFKTALSEYYGFVPDVEQVKELPTLRQKNTELEAKVNQNPFVNEEIKRLNELASKGASRKDFLHFLEAQDLDLSNMPEAEVYAQAMSRKYGMSVEKARQNFLDKFGDDDLDFDTEKSKIIELNEAKQYLNSMKVAAETPQSVQNQMQAEIQKQQFAQNWQQQIVSEASKYQGISGKYKNGDSELDFAVTVSPEQMQAILPLVMNDFVQQGVQVTPQNVGMVQEAISRYAAAINYSKIYETIHRDGYAKGEMAATKRLAGNLPPTTTTTPTVAPTNNEAFVAANKSIFK